MRNLKIFALCALISACATVPYEPYAREVKKKPREGGTIALNATYRPEDRSRADYLMSANCGDHLVKVAEEGEVVVGEKTNTSSNKTQSMENESGFRIGGIAFASAPRPGENTQVESQTTQVKEWQIQYQCIAQQENLPRSTSKKSIRRN
jgi:hypothetical protein